MLVYIKARKLDVVSCGEEIQFDFKKVAPRSAPEASIRHGKYNLALILLLDIFTYGSNR